MSNVAPHHNEPMRQSGTLTLIGHVCGNTDMLAIRLRDRLRSRRYDLQLWIEDGGCLVCAKPTLPAAMRVARIDPSALDRHLHQRGQG